MFIQPLKHSEWKRFDFPILLQGLIYSGPSFTHHGGFVTKDLQGLSMLLFLGFTPLDLYSIL